MRQEQTPYSSQQHPLGWGKDLPTVSGDVPGAQWASRLTFRAEPQGLKTPEGLTTGKNLGADDGEVFVAETLGRGTRKDLAHGFDDLRVDLQVLSQLHHVAQVFFDEVNTKVWREGSGAHARAGLETHHAGHGLMKIWPSAGPARLQSATTNPAVMSVLSTQPGTSPRSARNQG